MDRFASGKRLIQPRFAYYNFAAYFQGEFVLCCVFATQDRTGLSPILWIDVDVCSDFVRELEFVNFQTKQK
jgi:hypothetical protein